VLSWHAGQAGLGAAGSEGWLRCCLPLQVLGWALGLVLRSTGLEGRHSLTGAQGLATRGSLQTDQSLPTIRDSLGVHPMKLRPCLHCVGSSAWSCNGNSIFWAEGRTSRLEICLSAPGIDVPLMDAVDAGRERGLSSSQASSLWLCSCGG
jgi:hypothetical protein